MYEWIWILIAVAGAGWLTWQMGVQMASRRSVPSLDVGAFKPHGKSWFLQANGVVVQVNQDPAQKMPCSSGAVQFPDVRRVGDVLLLLSAEGSKARLIDPMRWPFRKDSEQTYESHAEATRAFLAVAAKLAAHPVLRRSRAFRRSIMRDAYIFAMTNRLLDMDLGSAPWSRDFNLKALDERPR